ncbi:hypothetical protein, partial [Undibacterium sp.]|uniref:hypothetical protein n=1 Tax=Undibacterium sp. TaxID=1914977 RepID=UPI0037539481
RYSMEIRLLCTSIPTDLIPLPEGSVHTIPLGAWSTLFERWRRIFGHFFRSSLKIASYFRLIHVITASKSASTIISNPNGNSGLNHVFKN